MGLLVLIVLTSSSIILSKMLNEQIPTAKAEESITYTLVEKIRTMMGLYEYEPPSGANPSFMIKDTSGNNLFEVDHNGNVYIDAGELHMNEQDITNATNITTKGIIFNTTASATCPRIYVNSSGCFLIESCDGSRIGQGAGC